MNYIDLFSGIGGFALGAYWAGMHFEKHYFSEVDPFAVELYQKRFPDAIPLGDIKEIDCAKLADTDEQGLEGRDGEELRECPGKRAIGSGDTHWLITGGFPCTDISVAGKGAGIRGKQSGLWFEYWRIIRDLRPRFAIMENVGALTFRGLDTVLGSLAEIGYDAEWQDIRAEDVGAPHRRERIWIVAYPGGGDAGSGAGQREGAESTHGQSSLVLPDASGGSRTAKAGSDNGDRGAVEMADADRTGPQIGTGQSTENLLGVDAVGRAGSAYWTVEPDVGRLAHGVSRRVERLRGLGNAIVPQIAELLFRQIKNQID